MPSKHQATYKQSPNSNHTNGSSSKQKLFSKLNGLYSAHTISRASKLASQPQMNPMAGYYYAPYATIGHQHQPPLTGLSEANLAGQVQQQEPIYGHHQPAANLAAMGLMFQRQLNYQPSPLSHHELVNHHLQLANRPLCRCRVMYLGSSVPHVTKNGLHGIQEPLRHLYPEDQFTAVDHKPRPTSSDSISSIAGAKPPLPPNTIDISHLSSGLGIDSWLSVWSNGLLLENFDEFGREIKRFFAIESLHYCAAVRFFDTRQLAAKPAGQSPHPNTPTNKTEEDPNNNGNAPAAGNQDQSKKSFVRFLPLDAPLFQVPGMMDPAHPPVFAAILRRTTGIKVLECHAFICRRDAASNALVRCCTQSYADLLSAKQRAATIDPRQQQQASSVLYPNYATQQRHRHHRALGPRRPMSLMGATEATRLRYSPTYESVQAQDELAAHASRSLAPDTSSEDNYAIILRQTYGKIKPSSHEKEEANGKSSRRRSRQDGCRRSGRSRAASTRSLFNDFQPAESRARPPSELTRADKHHRSMDPLGASRTGQEPQTGTCCNDEQVRYAVCRSGSKRRHSRSMQNLELAGGQRDSGRQLRRSRRSRRSKVSSSGGSGSRRAASFGDMPATTSGEALARLEPHSSKAPPALADEAPLYGGSYCADDYRANLRLSHQLHRDQVQWQAAANYQGGHRLSQMPPMGGQPLCCQPAYVPFYLAPAPLSYGLPAPPVAQPYTSNGPMYEPLLPVRCTPPALEPQAVGRHYTATGSGTNRKRNKDHSSQAGKSLISRFRCLSPPMNFVDQKPQLRSKAEHRASTRPLSEMSNASFMSKSVDSEACGPISGLPEPEVEAQSPQQEAPLSPASEQSLPASMSSLRVANDNVVSAAPGFIASRGSSSASGAAKSRAPRKLSWIKRLSLTMGGARCTPVSTEPALAEPAEQQSAAKRRGFFAGSLSIGRRRRQEPQPKPEVGHQASEQPADHESPHPPAAHSEVAALEPEVEEAPPAASA